MYISGLGISVPGQRYSQTECWEALCRAPQLGSLSPRSQNILRKVLLGDNGIQTRALAFNELTEAFDLRPDTLHARFALHAPRLAAEAAQRALEQAGRAASEVDALLISTCTGYLCPGLTSYVSERLGLPAAALCLDLVGQGCGAAMPNLQTASALLAGGGRRVVVSVCVEVCSAAFYLENDPGVLISACLFGDGAAAAVLAAQPGPGTARRVEWKNFATTLDTRDRELLRFKTEGGMLKNVLDKRVPAIAAGHSRAMLAACCQAAQLTPADITGWIIHAGGRDVLAAVRLAFGLGESDLRWSEGVLREFGNVSSPSVLFTLKAALEGGQPGGAWFLSSFGAGISCHGALIRVK